MAVIGVIAQGMMGAGVGRRLHESGAEVRTLLTGRSAKSAERAQAAGMEPAADDPGVDERGAGRGNDGADANRGLRADRVAVDINRLAVERLQRWRQMPCQRLRLARRQDRQEEIGAGKQRVFIGRGFHAGGLRPFGALCTAPGQQGANLRAAFVQSPADPSPHHPLRDYPDDRHSLPPAKKGWRSG